MKSPTVHSQHLDVSLLMTQVSFETHLSFRVWRVVIGREDACVRAGARPLRRHLMPFEDLSSVEETLDS